MIEGEREKNEITIPMSGEGWYEDIPEEFSSYPNPIYYRYTTDDELVKKEEYGFSKLLGNYGTKYKTGYSLNIFIRDDLKNEEKRKVFLHEIQEAYNIQVLGLDEKEAHKKAQEKYSIKD